MSREPVAPPSSADPRADELACEAILRAGSKSFHTASRLLPSRMRVPTMALYAFCRIADDEVDELEADTAQHAGAAIAAVERLGRRLDAVYRGEPADSPVDRLFARVVREHRIPRALPDALLDGMRWDAEGRSIADESALVAYAARVAAVVGVMMTLLMGERRPEVLARACDLGVAMQLTNIARDVGTDARMGRVYLPTTWLEEAGIDRAQLVQSPRFDPRLAELVQRLLQRADTLYRRADTGIALLPADCQRSILAARHIYAAIGTVIARRGHDSVTSRAVVSGARKLWLALRSLWGRLPVAEPAVLALPVLPEAAFLVSAEALDGSP